MRKLGRAVAALAILLVTPALAADYAMFTAELSGAAATKGGDADGKGSFSAHGMDGKLCYELTVSAIDAATMAHIHKGRAGTDGAPVIHLDTPKDGAAKGCVDVEKALLAAVTADPAGYYVNVHNAAYPAGAIRGQLAK